MLKEGGQQKAAHRSALGRRGEDVVCARLMRGGATILKRNFFARVGEIDIVACHRGIIYFIEVKTHGTSTHGTHEVYTRGKHQRFLRAVHVYRACNRFKESQPCRMLLAVVTQPLRNKPVIMFYPVDDMA